MSRVHIVGAGLAGLAAALRLADGTREIIVHASATHAGGRCRSYFDTTLGMEIDNGNHLLLSGNHAARDFLRLVGGEDQLVGPKQAEFAFVDLATRERWTLNPAMARSRGGYSRRAGACRAPGRSITSASCPC